VEILLSPFQKNGENCRVFYGKKTIPVGESDYGAAEIFASATDSLLFLQRV
jgi:hypothetical protein